MTMAVWTSLYHSLSAVAPLTGNSLTSTSDKSLDKFEGILLSHDIPYHTIAEIISPSHKLNQKAKADRSGTVNENLTLILLSFTSDYNTHQRSETPLDTGVEGDLFLFIMRVEVHALTFRSF